jgi:trimethylamine--corrinoid protein Co-methyltransferase
MANGTVASAPHIVGLDGVRRTGDQVGFDDLLKLGQMLNSIHFVAGYPVDPVDIHASVRHIHAAFDVLTLTDKHIHCYSLGRQKNRDCIEMVRIARGIDDETLDREPSIFTVINSNSPLRLDTPMLHGIIEMASRNQPVVMTPFTLAGAMAPVTLAGALAQQNAEALAGIAFCQIVRPAPVVYGGFTSNVDMQSGAPAFGTPEYVRTAMVGGQLARRYNLPYRSSNVCAANAVDAQAAYESVFALWGCVMGGVNMMMHGAGWMEGGLHASLGKMVLDADLLHMVSSMMDPVVVDDDTLAIDAIEEVGAGGHFFGCSTRRIVTAPPSTSRWSATGETTRAGTRRGGRRRPARPTIWQQHSSLRTRSRRWTRHASRSSKRSSPAGSPTVASPRTGNARSFTEPRFSRSRVFQGAQV